jgi:alpha-mannosidase
MKFAELIVLLPCHSLEDFPLYYEGDDADSLLAGWTALWHPALVASAQAVPTWCRVDAPPASAANRLLIAPRPCEERLPAGFAERFQSEGGLLVRQYPHRDAAVEMALAGLDGGPPGVDSSLVADFLALGFCRLQVELLTRQMRYSTNIDESHFRRELLAAAAAALARDAAESRTHLSQCFDLLNEARKYFYPVDSYLVDLTLVAPTTLGASLAAELRSLSPANLLVTAELLKEVFERHPESWKALCEALDAGRISLVGGEYREQDLPLLSPEGIVADLTKGIAECERLLGRRPLVFGRRCYGLTPLLPQILVKLGFQGALHFTLDEGHFPLGHQCKTRWEGFDSSAIDALARLPRDAARPETFLDFSKRMGESMDSDHVATVIFAHWPNQTSTWYDDLRRVTTFTQALGKFINLENYFSQTDNTGVVSKFEADNYRAPYLKQAVAAAERDPISRYVTRQRQSGLCEAVRAIRAISTLLTPPAERCGACPAESAGSEISPEVLEERRQSSLRKFAASLPRQRDTRAAGLLVVNPLSFARKIGVDLSALEPQPSSPATGQPTARHGKLVEVPAMGFTWIERNAEPEKRSKTPTPLALNNVLSNEFMEVTISPTGGGIQSIRDYRHRGNRLSQQIAFRVPPPPASPGDVWRDPDEAAVYSVMAADSVEVSSSGPDLGEIVSRGRLMSKEGTPVADFRQTTQLWAGSRYVVLEIQIVPGATPEPDPWNSYYAARFAWPEPTAELWRGIGLARQRTDAKRIEAPQFIEINGASMRTAILTAGLPYHRRVGLRMLDSLLICRGETARTFKLAIGVDLAQPALCAVELNAPPLALVENGPKPLAATGWFFHVDAKNVVATHWEALGDASQAAGAAGGFRVRLMETTGQAGRVQLRAFRMLAKAQQLDFRHQPVQELTVENDRIAIDITAWEWIEVEGIFA